VIVPKPLSLIGSSHDRSAERSSDGPDPRHDSIVQFPTAPVGNLPAPVERHRAGRIRHQGNGSGPGVYTSPTFSGYCVEYNLIQDNVFGLYLNSSGVEQTLVERNSFNDNNRPGSAGGDGIYSDQGLRNVLVERDVFTNHLSASMVYTSFVGQNENIVVRHNAVTDDASVVFFNSKDVLVENTILRANTDGIRLTTANGNLIAGNVVLHNGRDGIRVIGQSSGNDIVGNTIMRSGEHDAHDDTIGPGTAGTANYWIDNNCKTENRPGLCGHSHDDHDNYDASAVEAFDVALSSEPLVGGEIVLPTFAVPDEPVIPLLPELELPALVPDALVPASDQPWLDPETA
jgi:parallel beta-helix repeat protein